jgi:CobQ-like glutamine amidotransferase family enzyme
MIAERMVDDNGAAIREAVEEGTALLAVCGGYQLLGAGYTDVSGERQPGVHLFDIDTVAGSTRLIGNAHIECELPAIGARPSCSTQVIGFENHAGRTSLGESARALGTIVNGYGNDGSGKTEGCRIHHAVGTYLHGPLLPRNPQLTDWLLAAALAHAHGIDAATLIDEAPIPEPVARLEHEAARVSARRASDESR